MTVCLIQTDSPTRLNVAFHDGSDTGAVEGYVIQTSNDGEKRGYTPFNLAGEQVGDEAANPVLAATFVIDGYCEREVVVIDRQIAALKEQQADTTQPNFVLRSLPKRIEAAERYRANLQAGERGFPA